MRKTSRLSESSRQVIALMRQQGPLTLAQLRPLIGIADGEITKRLRNLCVSGWLEKIEGPELRWGICSAAAHRPTLIACWPCVLALRPFAWPKQKYTTTWWPGYRQT